MIQNIWKINITLRSFMVSSANSSPRHFATAAATLLPTAIATVPPLLPPAGERPALVDFANVALGVLSASDSGRAAAAVPGHHHCTRKRKITALTGKENLPPSATSAAKAPTAPKRKKGDVAVAASAIVTHLSSPTAPAHMPTSRSATRKAAEEGGKAAIEEAGGKPAGGPAGKLQPALKSTKQHHAKQPASSALRRSAKKKPGEMNIIANYHGRSYAMLPNVIRLLIGEFLLPRAFQANIQASIAAFAHTKCWQARSWTKIRSVIAIANIPKILGVSNQTHKRIKEFLKPNDIREVIFWNGERCHDVSLINLLQVDRNYSVIAQALLVKAQADFILTTPLINEYIRKGKCAAMINAWKVDENNLYKLLDALPSGGRDVFISELFVALRTHAPECYKEYIARRQEAANRLQVQIEAGRQHKSVV